MMRMSTDDSNVDNVSSQSNFVFTDDTNDKTCDISFRVDDVSRAIDKLNVGLGWNNVHACFARSKFWYR